MWVDVKNGIQNEITEFEFTKRTLRYAFSYTRTHTHTASSEKVMLMIIMIIIIMLIIKMVMMPLAFKLLLFPTIKRSLRRYDRSLLEIVLNFDMHTAYVM